MARKKVAPQLKLEEQQGQSGQKGPPTMNHDEAVSAIVTTASPCDGVFVTMLPGTMIIVVPFVFRRPIGLVPHNTRHPVCLAVGEPPRSQSGLCP